jgi:hypothetical protein
MGSVPAGLESASADLADLEPRVGLLSEPSAFLLLLTCRCCAGSRRARRTRWSAAGLRGAASGIR